MSTRNNIPPSEEVDLGQLFKMIGSAVKNIFDFIGSIFKQLFLAFVWVVFFLKKRALVLVAALIAGLILGIVLEKITPPSYKSSVTVKQNYPTGENLYGSIEYYNGLIRDNDHKVLSQILDLNHETAETIIGFSVSPVLTETDKVVMFDKYVQGLDSVAASKVDYKEFVDKIEGYKHKLQRITISSKARVNFKNVFDNIVKNINTNSFFVNEQTKDLFELQQQKSALELSLAQSDSLQRTYKRVLEQQMDNKSSSEIGITFEGNADKNNTREFDLYKNDVELRREIVQIDRRMKDKSEILEIISGKQENGYVNRDKMILGKSIPSKFYYGLLFTVLALIVFIGLEFFRFLERFKPEQ